MKENWVQKRRKNVRQVNVVSGSSFTNNEVSGVELKPRGPPRRHYFVSSVTAQVTTDALMNYCKQKDLSHIACREVASRRNDVKSFHLILAEAKTEIAELNETWPHHVILRRYFLKEEALSWIKSITSTNEICCPRCMPWAAFFNARSICYKMSDVVIFLLIHQPVFLSVSETWLNEDTMFHLDAAKTIGYVFS